MHETRTKIGVGGWRQGERRKEEIKNRTSTRQIDVDNSQRGFRGCVPTLDGEEECEQNLMFS